MSEKNNRTLGKTIKRLVLLTLLAATIAASVIVYLARSEPAYWKEHQRFLQESTPAQIEQLAKQVDTQLDALANLGLNATATLPPQPPTGTANTPNNNGSTQTKIKPQDVRINTDQTITLTNDQLAAVVQTRMGQWMDDRGYVKPAEITNPMVTVDDGNLVMAFQFQIGRFTQIVSGKFGLTIQNDGMAELSMKRFLVGKLPVPTDAIGEHLRKKTGGDPRAAQVGEWLEKLQHMEFKPVIELDHRRRARVQNYKLLDHGLELTVRIQDHKTYKAMNQVLAGVTTN